MLRPEEKFVLTRISESLDVREPVEMIEGEDPPDAYIMVGEEKILLEITQLSQFVLNKDGTVKTRLTQDMFGLRLLDELDRELGEAMPQDKNLLIHLKVPVDRPSKFKKQLRQAIQELIAKGEFPKNWKVLDLDGGNASLFIIPRDSVERKRIIGFIENTNSSADIIENAKSILDNRLSIKNEICAALPFKGPKWLGLFNQYWLADVDTYRLALRKRRISHGFERIFFIQDTGEVHML